MGGLKTHPSLTQLQEIPTNNGSFLILVAYDNTEDEFSYMLIFAEYERERCIMSILKRNPLTKLPSWCCW